jgi:polysaccharide export outer membrane protein
MRNILRTFNARAWRAAVVLSAAVLLAPAVTAQEPAQVPGLPTGMPQPAATAAAPAANEVLPQALFLSEDDLRLRAYDVIDVTVVDAPELSGTFRIGEAGSFTMPYLGEIQAAKATPDEVSAKIADGLRGRYLKSPTVTTMVRQYFVSTFYVNGAVRQPGPRQMRGPVSLIRLIAMSGGLDANHGSTAFVIRTVKPVAGAAPPASGDEEYKVEEVKIKGLLSGKMDANVTLQPGDYVTIPPADVFYVAGEVNRQGPLVLNEGTTLRQAISLAGGTTFNAAKDKSVIFRENPRTGTREEIKVDLGDVMNGKDADIAIRANDIVIVPNSAARSLGKRIIETVGVYALRAPFIALP